MATLADRVELLFVKQTKALSRLKGVNGPLIFFSFLSE